MKCNICGTEAKHYLMASGFNVCQQCEANIARIVMRDRIHYALLIYEAAAATSRQLEEERIDELGSLLDLSV